MQTESNDARATRSTEQETPTTDLPDNDPGLLVVDSLTAFAEAVIALKDDTQSPVQAIVWRRPLPLTADFNALARAVGAYVNTRWPHAKISLATNIALAKLFFDPEAELEQKLYQAWVKTPQAENRQTPAPGLPEGMNEALSFVRNDLRELRPRFNMGFWEMRCIPQTGYNNGIIHQWHQDSQLLRITCFYNNPTMEWREIKPAESPWQKKDGNHSKTPLRCFRPGDITCHFGTARSAHAFLHRAPPPIAPEQPPRLLPMISV